MASPETTIEVQARKGTFEWLSQFREGLGDPLRTKRSVYVGNPFQEDNPSWLHVSVEVKERGSSGRFTYTFGIGKDDIAWGIEAYRSVFKERQDPLEELPEPWEWDKSSTYGLVSTLNRLGMEKLPEGWELEKSLEREIIGVNYPIQEPLPNTSLDEILSEIVIASRAQKRLKSKAAA